MKKYLQIRYLYWLLLFCLVYWMHWKNLHNSDEGVLLEGAWNMFNGKELYTDFFEFIPPGNFYLIFWFWKFFTPSYNLIKFISIIIFFFCAFGIYKICRIFNSSILNYITPVFFVLSSYLWPLINHNVYNLFFLIWSTYFFIKGLANRQNTNFVISGLLSAGAIIFLQQKGLAFLGITTLYLLILFFIERNRKLLYLLALYLFFSIAPLGLLLFKWSAKTLYVNLIEFPLFSYIKINSIPKGIFFFFLFLTIIFVIFFRKEKSKKILFLLLLQITLLLTTLTRPDYYHVLLIIFPLYALLPSFVKKIKFESQLLKIYCFSFILVIMLLITLPSVTNFFVLSPVLKNIKTNETIEFVKNNCPRVNDLYAGPFIPGLYFETKKINFTPYYILLTSFQGEEEFNETRNLLKKNQPRCIVMNYRIVEKFNYDKNNPVDLYIEENYILEKQINSNKIFIKK
ncbi:hypothetical protein ACFLZ9_01735 [Patescibacteria group bacterium]